MQHKAPLKVVPTTPFLFCTTLTSSSVLVRDGPAGLLARRLDKADCLDKASMGVLINQVRLGVCKDSRPAFPLFYPHNAFARHLGAHD